MTVMGVHFVRFARGIACAAALYTQVMIRQGKTKNVRQETFALGVLYVVVVSGLLCQEVWGGDMTPKCKLRTSILAS